MTKPPALRREVERTRHHQTGEPGYVPEMVGVGLLLAMLALKIAQEWL
jgi:hypothetical protein